MPCTFSVRVQPGARKDGVQHSAHGWKIAVAAPPVDGQANERLERFLAKEVLGLPRAAVRVKAGASGRNKLLEIDAELAFVEEALRRWESHAS